MTNTESHLSFPLVPKSVILNDFERRNGVITLNASSFEVNLCQIG